MKPGLNVILGPTGCGKTTFLDVLAGRTDPSLVSGVVLVNGKERPSNFKLNSAYVSQDDFTMGSLTVRENLSFSAALRLPACVTRKDRKSRVDALITKLGLTSVADVKIGSALVRGISGGERKRTNIGIELITDPSVMFLDEPTTGLDTYTASKLMRLLKRLTADGKTIIASIHQPNSSIYRQFDSVTLLCNGRAIYHGPAADNAPLNYFRDLGYKVSAHENPADFFIDLLHQDLPAVARSRLKLRDGCELANEVKNPEVADNAKHLFVSPSRTRQLQHLFEKSTEWCSWTSEAKLIFSTWYGARKPSSKLMSRECSSSQFHSVSGSEAELSPLMLMSNRPKNTAKSTTLSPGHIRIESTSLSEENFVSCSSEIEDRQNFNIKNASVPSYQPIPLYRQFAILACRGFLDTMRDPQGVAVPFAAVAVFTLILGSVYYRLGLSSESGLQDRTGLFYFICLELAYFNSNAVDIFIRDRARFKHERACGFYRTSTYFFAKVLCEVLPIKLGPVFFFFPILYAMTGLRRSFAAMFFWEATCLLMGAASSGIVILCILLLDHVPLGYAVSGIILSFMMTFGGFLVNIVSTYRLGWCRYLSIFWYAFSAMSINEIHGVKFCPMTTNTTLEVLSSPFVGSDFSKTSW
ncbi:hypothetical protein Aperf_G00000125855 [Anoplocephala perfoliata]